MNRISRCDWLPELPKIAPSYPLGIRALSRKYTGHALVLFSHIINPLLAKLEVKMAGYWPRSFLRVYA